ncbi:MAG TPA: hypothetical protein VGF69_08165 [Thermoanaerobaculia bacterium]|jgi:hypothetical protein
MKLRRALIATTTVVLLGLGFLAFTQVPVVLRFADPSELRPPFFTMLNPFREKAPEDVAETLLSRLQSGDLSALDIVQTPGGVSINIREKEREYPLRRWKLTDRRDSGGRVTLVYQTARITPDHLESPVVMVIERRSDQ